MPLWIRLIQSNCSISCLITPVIIYKGAIDCSIPEHFYVLGNPQYITSLSGNPHELLLIRSLTVPHVVTYTCYICAVSSYCYSILWNAVTSLGENKVI